MFHAENELMGTNVKQRFPATLVALLAVAFFVWFYAGFFFPSLEGEARHLHRTIMAIVRVSLPVAFVMAMAAYFGWQRGRIRGRDILLCLASVSFAALVIGPLLLLFSISKHVGKDLVRYHPYLQLAPPAYSPRPQGAGDGEPIRIFCMGGSTTEFKDSQGKDWPSRVERLLGESNPGSRIEVHNFGRQWYTSLHTLINYETNLRQHRPDVIIIMHAINDLLQNAEFARFSNGAFRRDYGHFMGPVTRLVKRPTLWSEISSVWREIWYAEEVELVEQDTFKGIESFRNNLSCLIDLAKLDGTKIVLVTQPTLLKEDMSAEEQRVLHMVRSAAVGGGKQWSAFSALRGMRAYNEATRSLARQHDLPLIDLDQAVPRDLSHFTDEVHYRDQAFDKVAKEVAEAVGPVLTGRANQRLVGTGQKD